MRKIVMLTPILAMLGVGNAAAFDAASGFGPSDENDQPIPRFQIATPYDRSVVTSSVGSAGGSFGYSTGTDTRVGFSAAQGFGPSNENDQPIPRFQFAR